LVNEEEAAFSSEESSETNIGVTTTSVEAQTDILVETRSIGTQTDPLEDLQTRINQFEKEICDLQDKLENARFDIDQFKDSRKDIAFFTGFADYETLLLCFDILKESAENLGYGYKRKSYDGKNGRRRKLDVYQEYIMVLMKLRLGLFNRDLCYRFKLSESTISIIFRTWMRFMSRELGALIRLPPREVINLHMPSLFKECFPQTVLIIDCTETEMERPSALDNQSACYSSYKSRTTKESLVGITPSGVVAFVSELYPGSVSDKEITTKSGLLDILQQGDQVMADKGFTIQDDLAAVGASLVMSEFLQGKKQFTKEEAEKNKKVACLRVHVERCMERIKNWHILDRKMSVTSASIASDIFTTISALTNFQPPLIQ